MMECKNCNSPLCDARGKIEISCYGYIPKTNADHIRSMTDEELAKAIACPYAIDPDQCNRVDNCNDCCLDWLKQPYKEGEE